VRTIGIAIVVAIAIATPAMAAPSIDDAAGQQRYDEGRYEQALPAFEAAFAAYPVAELQFNVGLCHERLGHTAAAITAFEAYLSDDLDSTDRADVEARLVVLRASLPAPSPAPTAVAVAESPTTMRSRGLPPAPRRPRSGNGRRMVAAGATVAGLGVVIGVAGGLGFGIPAARGEGTADRWFIGELTAIGVGAAALATGVGLLVVGRRRHRDAQTLAWVTVSRGGIRVVGRF
jgi:tetratricopeptide (TPR) repeat protein